MPDVTRHTDRPFLQLLVRHDDPTRELGYETGSEQARARAAREGWTVVSMRNDGTTVF